MTKKEFRTLEAKAIRYNKKNRTVKVMTLEEYIKMKKEVDKTAKV